MRAPHRYSHTQTGWLHFLLWILAAAAVVASFLADDPLVATLLGAQGCLLGLVGACFARLTVQDEGARLAIRFGPVPLFARTVPFAAIRSVRRARSHVIDGFGIHWVPLRGWTWNLSGFDCVELELEDGRRLRIGSDDADLLARHVESRLVRVPAR